MKKLARGSITTGSGTLLYTVPTQYRTEVSCIDVANTTTGSLTFKLHLVPVGGSPDATNMLFPDVAIAANSMLHWTGLQLLTAGDFIQAIGSGAGITVNLTGEEVHI